MRVFRRMFRFRIKRVCVSRAHLIAQFPGTSVLHLDVTRITRAFARYANG